MYDIFYIGDNEGIKDNYPFAKQISDESNINPKTSFYWLIEPNTEIIDFEVLEFTPSNYDRQYEHVWKWNNNNYGGVRLLPKKGSKGVKEINQVVCKKKFDILNSSEPSNYFEEHPYATHVWCVDPEYKLTKNIDWAPDNFEPTFIHSFHLRGQLEHKYPDEEGGIKLYPKEWKEADTKYHSFLDANVTYPILYVKNVDEYAERDILDDDYVWLVDYEYKTNVKTFDWVPSPFEENMIHCFRMPYQLTEKYPMAMGGIRLVPKNWRREISPAGIYTETEIKIHPACPIEDEEYDVFFVEDDEFDADTYSEYAKRSKTNWFWIVDRDFEFNGKLLFVPASHETEFIHVFKIPGHLEYRYPVDNQDPWDIRCGGVRLVNKNFDFTKHKYQDGIVPVRYDIFFVDNPKNFSSIVKKSRTKMFWCIDSEHSISQILNYVPSRDEQKYLLNFKIPDQLKHKYPDQEGGVYLIPKKVNDNTSIKYKGNLSVKSKEYPILYVEDVEDLSVVTEDSWVIDKEYQIDDDIDWTPSSFESNHIHSFHVPGQLKHKYPDTMGGVRWVPVNWSNEYVIHDDLPVKPKKYPVILVDDPNDYTQAKGQCWLIDSDYIIDQDFEWVPSNFEKDFIHTFHVDGQLEHKYPEEIGGIRWVPFDWESAETKIHADSPFTKPVFEKYTSEDEGREQTTKDWFWVIEPDVEVNSDFDFNYIPTIWDSGKTHIWQKLNPITGKQYDYGGVMLCPKVPQTKGRPKYIREVCSTQKEYPVFYMSADDVKNGIDKFYKNCAEKTKTNMFWVVDYCVQVCESFNFSYYPTQWDIKNVHVWQNESGEHTDIRLCPTTLFLDNITEKDIVSNTFENLKLMPKQASETPEWNHYIFGPDVPLKKQLEGFSTMDNNAYFWTIDSNVDIVNFNGKYKPAVENADKVHVWQKLNPRTNNVHAYGGVRLWPNPLLDVFKTSYSSDDVKYSKTQRGKLQYVKEALSTSKPYDIVFLSYKEEGSSNAYERLTARFNAIWVKDIKGIFNAHKEAANRVKSDLFWVVDADADISEDFDFSYIPDVYDEEVVHVWASKNPVTGEEYGYGGVKLFNRQQILDATSWGLDFTTGLSNRFKAMPEISCTTRFNTDGYSTWRSAFRECVKLTLSDDVESDARLNSWLNPLAECDYRDYAVRGAKEGKAFALENKNNLTELNNINDYDWLRNRYNKTK